MKTAVSTASIICPRGTWCSTVVPNVLKRAPDTTQSPRAATHDVIMLVDRLPNGLDLRLTKAKTSDT